MVPKTGDDRSQATSQKRSERLEEAHRKNCDDVDEPRKSVKGDCSTDLAGVAGHEVNLLEVHLLELARAD
jgi:hypothetical protein